MEHLRATLPNVCIILKDLTLTASRYCDKRALQQFPTSQFMLRVTTWRDTVVPVKNEENPELISLTLKQQQRLENFAFLK